jgi:hypothetical protein
MAGDGEKPCVREVEHRAAGGGDGPAVRVPRHNFARHLHVSGDVRLRRAAGVPNAVRRHRIWHPQCSVYYHYIVYFQFFVMCLYMASPSSPAAGIVDVLFAGVLYMNVSPLDSWTTLCRCFQRWRRRSGVAVTCKRLSP